MIRSYDIEQNLLKYAALVKSLIVCFIILSLCACSDDDDMLYSGNSITVEKGESASIVIRLLDVGSSTRAASPGFEEGGPDEYAVDNATFYLYDSNYNYLSSGTAWNGGTPSNTENSNIEFNGNAVILLKEADDLTQTYNFPMYVLTVLNKPEGYEPPTSLSFGSTSQLTDNLSDENDVGIIDANGNFVMSSSSYFSSEDYSSDDYKSNFSHIGTLTEINSTDVQLGDIDNITNPIDIYVERLAAKVTLKVSDELSNTVKQITEDDGNLHTLYEIPAQMIARMDDDESDIIESSTNLYVDLEGWKLNATARHSFMFKALCPWTNNDSSDDYYIGDEWLWNDSEDHRSYWGASFNSDFYGNYNSYRNTTDYPTSSEGNTSKDEEYESTWLNESLKYVNLEDEADSPLLPIDRCDYCAENTNTAGDNGEIQSKYSSAITSILVKAKICDEKGNGVDVISYNGMLYTKEAYINYALSHYALLNYTHYMVGNHSYPIDADCVKLYYLYDGKVEVVLDFDSDKAPFYRLSGGTFFTATEIVDDGTPYIIFDGLSVAYMGGDMYYDIPIEHLRPNMEDEIETGNYGVVRNHHYVVTINALDGLGWGIYDPEEVIIPQEEYEDDLTRHSLDAETNILSWKVVDQRTGI
ncbi:MAG: Mfa1 family fimbria major subunit [Prevotella sp.]|nr:Mfa1 family fimbria major subunit [Prevotella sp.]